MAIETKTIELEEITPNDSVIPVYLIPLTAEQLTERELWEAGQSERDRVIAQEERRQAYILESDPLNFKWQETQLETDRQAWLDKKAEIQARYPEPTI